MDPKLLRYYNRELQHIREMGGEFAREYPKIAGRLGLEGFECADPYVERLLEGFGFLAARVQLKIDAEFPRFTRHLFEMVYPHYLAPTPSMAVVQMEPDLSEGALANGFRVPRGSVLRSRLGKGEQTPCQYQTAHDVYLWPLELLQAEYFTYSGKLDKLTLPGLRAKTGLRLRLRASAGLNFDQLSLQSLPIYLRGSDDFPMRLYEHLLAGSVAVVLKSADPDSDFHQILDKDCIKRAGFAEEQALIPYGGRSFSGYRLLHEYFSFPQRFMFVELTQMDRALQQLPENLLDIVFLLDSEDHSLEKVIDESNFALFCTPVINLFARQADRIHISDREHEYHVVPDRSRPMDFEIYQIKSVTGFGTSADEHQNFLPFYEANDYADDTQGSAYFAVHRRPRILSSRQRRQGPRSSYLGSEVYVSLVDSSEAPYRSDLRQLSISALCTNRDLPLYMSVGQGPTDFTLEIGAPVQSLRCIAGPTSPKPSYAEGDTSWRLVSHLALNYLSLADTDETEGAAALRELLMLYGDAADATVRKQIEGVRSIKTKALLRRLSHDGPLSFARGLEVELGFTESYFEGSGVFLLGAVLEQFFAKYVSINSFTETVIRTQERGEVMRWPARVGRRQIL